MTDFAVVSAGTDVTRPMLSDHSDLRIGATCFTAGGAISALHIHSHKQPSFGEGEARLGDRFVIPSEQTHGCIPSETSIFVPRFSPRRDDFH